MSDITESPTLQALVADGTLDDAVKAAAHTDAGGADGERQPIRPAVLKAAQLARDAEAHARDRQHVKGKLTARERLDLLLDTGTFEEIGRFSGGDINAGRAGAAVITGFGGMASMRKLYLDRFLGHEIPTDILQEALPNVVAAHVMQSYIGGYGNMVQPVSACATAAVSLEEGADKIALGKAGFVVTGAIDDIGVESVIGFGNMNATANSQEMLDKGIEPRFFSRANDRRRGGFVESQGGGTVLLTRGDIALKLGLPVAGVIGFVHSYADGAHTSIPAPGLGALAAGMGGRSSKLVRDLATLGVTPDDIAVVSKHDTSTNANDPNESELHNTLAHAIGRTDSNPLFVISQKSLTGHAKGGACVFQVNGITQLFRSGTVPANAALECVDPKLERDDHMVWLRSPLAIGSRQTVKAALATSLGFGHVSGFAAIVHPGAFEAAVAHTCGVEALNAWRARANARLAAGQRRLEEGMMGRAALYEPIDNRRFREDGRGYDAHEVEKAMLLDPDARLGADGVYDAR